MYNIMCDYVYTVVQLHVCVCVRFSVLVVAAV